jgi:hypothetical protein
MDSNQNTGLNRNTIDKYYTKIDVAKKCIDLLDKYYYIENFDNIIEPSAGNGSFSKQVKNCVAYDIKPGDDTIKKQDFLKFKAPKGTTIIIGNPPFGRQSSIAKAFIIHACTFALVIAFILPKSFKKKSFQKTFPLKWHLIDEIDLPINSFTVDDVVYDVPCVFQIWGKEKKNRIIEIFNQPNWLEYTTADNADLSIRRVGVYAGKASIDLSLSKQSHYFIKVNTDIHNTDIHNLIDRLNNVTWDFNNTVGPNSISKDELHQKIIQDSL